MAMGIVSNTDFNSELSSLGKKTKEQEKEEEIEKNEKGRGLGNVEVPNTLRKLIGDESITNGRQAAIELARSFGLSPSSVSAYTNGSTSTSSYKDKPNEDVISTAKLRVSMRARKKLMMALNHITNEKLSDEKAKDLAGIAKDMSFVMRNMNPPANQTDKSDEPKGPTFVFYSPKIVQEEHLDAVYVKE